MKNNMNLFSKYNKIIILILFIILLPKQLFSEELNIFANNVKSFKNSNETIFSGSVIVTDSKGNELKSEKVNYNSAEDKVASIDRTEITSKNGYIIQGKNILFDNLNQKITSFDKAEIKDVDGNLIYLDMFEFNTKTGFIFSKGNIEIKDNKNNNYSFSELYIDQKNKKIVGTDAKGYLGPDYKNDPNNDPRFFSNSMIISNQMREFNKGIFTYCKDRGEDKCPVWNLQAEKIKHDVAKKTIYYDNAVLKFFDFPIFIFQSFFILIQQSLDNLAYWLLHMLIVQI